MSLYQRAAARSVKELVRLACLFALAGLGLMIYPILVPDPLPVILGMTLGHTVCVAAVGAYALAILVDAMRDTKTKHEGDDAGP